MALLREEQEREQEEQERKYEADDAMDEWYLKYEELVVAHREQWQKRSVVKWIQEVVER